jgi:hypothetical protein
MDVDHDDRHRPLVVTHDDRDRDRAWEYDRDREHEREHDIASTAPAPFRGRSPHPAAHRARTSQSSLSPPSSPGSSPPAGAAPIAGYTVMVAGRRAGKTAFLRLLLDTVPAAGTATAEQLAGVARFVHGAAASTSHIRHTALAVALEGRQTPLTLAVVDTPALEFEHPDQAERVLAEVVRFVESRFEHSLREEVRRLRSFQCSAPYGSLSGTQSRTPRPGLGPTRTCTCAHPALPTPARRALTPRARQVPLLP